MRDISVLGNIIVGRVDPHIYAFTTGTVPNYLKVGDTYRPVSVRLNEWKEYFPDLEKQYEEIAKVDSDVYFRDFAIHYFLESEKKRIRLQQADIPAGVYYSKMSFSEKQLCRHCEAIEDITRDYQEKGGKYQFYNAETRLAETFTYARTENYEPRPNQQETINRFKAAVNVGRIESFDVCRHAALANRSPLCAAQLRWVPILLPSCLLKPMLRKSGKGP